MESNRDEAERCIQLAKQAFENGDRAKAERLLTKAENLYSGVKGIDALRNILNKLSESKPDNSQQSKSTTPPRSPTRKEHESKSVGPEYTQSQVDAVRKIKLSKDYYEILAVEKTSTDTDLKKAYRKLALQFHPDKNKAPGSGEAFKAIGNAFAILSDPEKRKQYDLYGTSSPHSSSSGRSGRHEGFTYTRGFESEMTAEELFNMFFGGGFPSQTVYTQNNRRQRARYFYTNNAQGNGEQAEASNATMALQVLPILFFILVTLISSFFVQDPVYSLARTQKYNLKKLTYELEVPYYVKESFQNDYQGNIKRLEALIEEEYISNLRNECFKQRNYKEHMLWRARNFGDEEMQRQARDMNLPSCDALHNLRQKSRYAA